MAASCAVLVNFEPQQRNLYIKKKGCEGQTELVRGSISSFNHVCLCVCVLVTGWVRIAVIVKKAMRSDPDVHSLGMTDLRVIRLGVTDLTSLCLCQHLVILSHHQLLKHNQMVSDLKGKVGVDCAEGKAYLVKLVGHEGQNWGESQHFTSHFLIQVHLSHVVSQKTHLCDVQTDRLIWGTGKTHWDTKPNCNQTQLSALQTSSEECHTCWKTRHSSVDDPRNLSASPDNNTHAHIPIPPPPPLPDWNLFTSTDCDQTIRVQKY